MRIATWNCQGQLWQRNKLSLLVDSYHPDIAVIPEGERPPERSELASATRRWAWHGDQKLGVAIFAFGDYELAVHPAFEPRHQFVLPLLVTGPQSFVLFAVWTVKARRTADSPAQRFYIDPVRRALETYSSLLSSPSVVWAGDFNNSISSDRPSDPIEIRFATFVKHLKDHHITSAYHAIRNCDFGSEPEATWYNRRKVAHGGQMDYIFASNHLLTLGSIVDVGAHSTWSPHSDHMPLVCTFPSPAVT